MTGLAYREPTELEAAAAHEVELAIKTELGAIRHAWVELAKHLVAFQDGELWRALGHDSFEAWLASPEIELDRSTVFRLTGAYRELVLRRGVAPGRLAAVDMTKVREILPAIRRGHKTPDEALVDAETLSRRDLHTHYAHITTRPPNDPLPPLDASAEPVYTTCPACGQRMEVR